MVALPVCLSNKISEIREKISKIKGMAFIVSDQTVWDLYGKEFDDLNIPFFLHPPGEQSKTQAQKWAIEKWLFSSGCCRSSILIAFGGGVTSDLVGFVAATFMRGISWIACPTTLLSLVDASIGGKNGINTSFGKNTLGTFYEPVAIWRELSFLQTLPAKELQNGFAEICKYALVGSLRLFDLLKFNLFSKNFFSPPNLNEIVEEAIRFKECVVKQDYQESLGLRYILNFGHTLGHVIELLSHYTVQHGEAILWGMLFSVHLSYEKGILSSEEKELSTWLLEGYRGNNFVYPLTGISSQKIYSLLKSDKKNTQGAPSFVLLKNIGQPYFSDRSFCTKISFKEFEKSLTWLSKYNKQ